MIDISKIRPGDEVTVRGKAQGVLDRGLIVQVFGEREPLSIVFKCTEIASHTPEPLHVGDRVGVSGVSVSQGCYAKIVHISSKTAWVRWGDTPDNGNIIALLADLEPIP